MKVFSQLEKAQLENTTSDTGSLPKGMITYRTDLNIAKVSDGTSMLALIDESSTQTLSGKTYASPITTGAIQGAQIATPANPSAGNNKLYFKSDGKLYTLDSSGNEAAVGSGTGGVKNLITNGNADDTASSIFVPYADTGTRPVDGTGGSPTVTTSISSSTPLDGAKSFLLTKPASNVQGQGWAVPFTVDPAYRAKSLKISVDYIVNSGTFVAGGAGAESDVIWYIYDVTNSQLIEPSNIKMFSNNSSLSDKFEATFQSSATGSSYRLIAHVQSVSALAYELKVDNVTVSPQTYVFGTPVTDWVAYTPTIVGFGTPTVADSFWRRVGDSIFIRGRFLSGVSTGVTASISLPTGLTVDTTKETTTSQYGTWATDSTFLTGYIVVASGATALNMTRSDSPITPSLANTIAASGGTVEYVTGPIPIQGWSSSVQTSDNADTRIVSMSAYKNGGSITANTTIAAWTAAPKDSHGAFNLSTGEYTVPTAGDYFLNVGLGTAAIGNGYIKAYVNAVLIKESQGADQENGFYGGSFLLTNLKAGDKITIALSASKTLLSSNVDNFIDIFRLSGPSAIAASEDVSARYYSTAGQSIADSGSLMATATKDYDTHNAVSSSVFTCPVSGEYEVVGSLCFAASGTSGIRNISLYKNGSLAQYGNTIIPNASFDIVQQSTFRIKCVAGDTLQIFAFQNAGVAKSLTTVAGQNWASYRRVGKL